MKQKPKGFIAICQCGMNVGVMDYERTDRKEAGVLLGRWIHEGCTVKPFFTGTTCVQISSCQCGSEVSNSDN